MGIEVLSCLCTCGYVTSVHEVWVARIPGLKSETWGTRAPGRAHSLGGERPLHTRQGEVLAERQGCPSRGGIRRKPQAKRCSDEQPADRRRRSWVSRRVPVKPSTCTEGCGVNPTEISVKASAQYPGRSGGLPCATCIARCGDEAPEVSKGHSSVDSLGNQEGAKA